MSDRNNMKLFALNSNHEIAQKIAETVGVPLGKLSSRQFSDGEIQVNIEESVRGYDVYIIQSTSYPVSNHLMELLIMVDACVIVSTLSFLTLVMLVRIVSLLLANPSLQNWLPICLSRLV